MGTRRRPSFAGFLAFAIGAAVVTACTPTGPATPTGAPTPAVKAATAVSPTAAPKAAAPKTGGTLKYGIGSNPPTLDPMAAFQWNEWHPLIFNTLVQFDEQFAIKPELAESWQVDATGTTYTFRLRSGVRFHNGSLLTSQDVKWSLERLKREGAARTLVANMESVTASDPTTVQVKLTGPDAALLSTFASYTASILPALDNNDFKANPIGSGPFKFESFTQNTSARVSRFANYWEPGRPYLDGIDFQIITDRQALAAALISRAVDVAAALTPADFENLKRQTGITPYQIDSKSWYAIWPNTQRPPWDNARVRRALAMAYDREAMVRAITLNYGKPSTGFVMPHWHWAYADLNVYRPTADTAGARALLTQAGFPDGVRSSITATPTLQHTVQMALQVQQQARAAGFDLEVKSLEFAAWLAAATQSRDFDLLPYNSTQPGIDPDQLLRPFYYTGAGFNLGRYANPEVDRLLDQGRTVSDQNQRKSIYAQIQRILAEDAANMPILIPQDLNATRDYVKDARFLPAFQYHLLRYMWLDR